MSSLGDNRGSDRPTEPIRPATRVAGGTEPDRERALATATAADTERSGAPLVRRTPSDAAPTTPAAAKQPDQPSIGVLGQDVSRHLSDLVRAEVELAKAEVTTSAKQAALGGALFAAAGVLVALALPFGFIALAEGIHALGLWRWLSYLIVFGFFALLAGLLALVGKARLKRLKAPERTISTLKESSELTKHLKA